MAHYASLSKNHFRNIIKDILYEKNRAELLKWTEKYKKVDHETCSKEKFEVKSYFKTMSIARSRLYFKVLNYITPTIRENFKSDKKFREVKFICSDCMEEEGSDSKLMSEARDRIEVDISSRRFRGYPDNQIHQMKFCRANQDLREGKNIMESENDCVTFFQQLLDRRMNKLG